MVTRAAGTGPISLSDINVELGKNETDTIGLGQLDVRQLSRVNAPPFQMFNLFSKYRGATIYGIFVFGTQGGSVIPINVSNKLSNSGSIAADVTTAGPGRESAVGTSYGLDKGIVVYGIYRGQSPAYKNLSNLISNTGVVASDTSIVGTPRTESSGSKYGYDKAIVGFGFAGNNGPATPVNGVINVFNLITNTGVLGSDNNTSAAYRWGAACAPHSYDKAVFAFGAILNSNSTLTFLNSFNQVTNTGVIGSDTIATGTTARHFLAAAGYGDTKAAFFGGQTTALGGWTNGLSLMEGGVTLAQYTTTVTGRSYHTGCTYNVTNATFAWGTSSGVFNGLTGALRLNSLGSFITSGTNLGTTKTAVAGVAYSNFV
jgi:hypothetical protein